MIKFLIVNTLLIFMFSNSSVAQSSEIQILPEDYKKLNDSEQALMEYKDSERDLLLKIMQLDVINQSRKKYKVKPLKLDILASRVANKMCKEAALNNFVGHWNLAGEKPYIRYAFAGGVDHVSENASGEMTTGKFDNNDKSISLRMVNNHKAFMDERKPNDGHKQTVIEKNHNYVGIGFYAIEKQFRYYELYIDRYYDFAEFPVKLKKGEEITLRCRPATGNYFNLLLAYYEKMPRPMSPGEVSSRFSYNDFSDEIALEIAPWEIDKYLDGTWYNLPLKFDKPGLYYIHIYSDNKPYKEGSRFSTEGKVQASGVVIQVY